jgi:hypothetical protein
MRRERNECERWRGERVGCEGCLGKGLADECRREVRCEKCTLKENMRGVSERIGCG